MQASHRVPKLTRCTFQFIADVLRTIDFDSPADRERCIAEFTDALKTTNAGFKPERFVDACKAVRRA